MIHIAICDDEIKIGAELERALIKIFGKLNIKCEIDVFYTAEELCNEMDANRHYDLIFLDIVFAGEKINGVEVGRFIRDIRHNYLTSIVYISWEKKYALELFEIQPLNFLIKPLKTENIDEIIRKYLKIAGLWAGVFTYKIGHDVFKAQVKDIIYLESYDRKLILHLINGKNEEFYGSLKNEYEHQLKKFDFLFIHNAFVVNYDYITALKFSQVSIVNSEQTLPISKHRRSEVREKYYEIMKRRIV